MKRHTTPAMGHAIVLLALLPGAAWAEPAAFGPEVQVNTYTTGAQSNPSVAAMSDGEFVVVWESVGSFGNDSSGYSVQARRFAAGGSAVGAEFQVNDVASGNQRIPHLVPDGSGQIFAAWADPDGGIDARLFAADGVFDGPSFAVADTSVGTEKFPRLAMGSGLEAVWENALGGGGSEAWTRAFTVTGEPVGADFVLSDAEIDQSGDVDVAATRSTKVVVWTQTEDAEFDVVTKTFVDEPSAQEEVSALATCTSSIQQGARVATHPDGGFLATWATACVNGSGGFAGRQVVARPLDAAGTPFGAELTVSATTGGVRLAPALSVEPGGGWVSAWHASGLAGDGEGNGIAARRMHPDGTPDGEELAVNTYTTGSQSAADIASLADGSFVVVWTSDVSPGDDDSGRAIVMRRYDATKIFRDGFESGGPSEWDAAVGTPEP